LEVKSRRNEIMENERDVLDTLLKMAQLLSEGVTEDNFESKFNTTLEKLRNIQKVIEKQCGNLMLSTGLFTDEEICNAIGTERVVEQAKKARRHGYKLIKECLDESMEMYVLYKDLGDDELIPLRGFVVQMGLSVIAISEIFEIPDGDILKGLEDFFSR
jgi:hypothetical protein